MEANFTFDIFQICNLLFAGAKIKFTAEPIHAKKRRLTGATLSSGVNMAQDTTYCYTNEMSLD
jgi:hypothetical protein